MKRFLSRKKPSQINLSEAAVFYYAFSVFSNSSGTRFVSKINMLPLYVCDALYFHQPSKRKLSHLHTGTCREFLTKI